MRVAPASAPITIPGGAWRFPLFLALVLGTLLAGSWMMLGILASEGLTALEILILGLFVPTFGWIALAFWTAVLGFALQVARVDPLSLRRLRSEGAPRPDTPAHLAAISPPLPPEVGRTAVVMPAFNEDPHQAMGGLVELAASLAATGSGAAFDLHFLSDTTDPERARREAEAWQAVEAEWGARLPALHYRRRADNSGRKPGNIGAFCREHGDAYDYLVVLDADSRMEGGTLVALVRTMEANPRAGLLQTVPLPADQDTLFGRLLQFAGALYGPMLARGYAFWQGESANYWGHNAILRLAPFFEHGHLPVLPGSPPLGGEILSHDFVEGALLRRGGWHVYLLTELGGSHEGLPGNLVDFGRRDRRWAQGSLQHLRLLTLPGLRPISRFHFLTGAMGYLSSVFWFFLLLAGTAWVAGTEFLERRPAPSGTRGWEVVALTPDGWERVDDGARSGWAVPELLLPPAGFGGSLLAVTALLLFLPRVLAVLSVWIHGSPGFRGRMRVAASALLETGFTVVMAPVLMWSHTRYVLGILSGRTIQWESQPREGRVVGWEEAWRWARSATLLGAAWTVVSFWASPFFTLWLLPILLGLVLAVPLVRLTSLRRAGLRARDAGLFLAPGELAFSADAGPGAWAGAGAAARTVAEVTRG